MRCGYDETKVLESRISTDGKNIRRRRVCLKCEYRFTTHEREEHFTFHIKKRAGNIEPYQRDKALRSIQIACQKRQIRIDQMEFMLSKTEVSIQELGQKIISSRQLGSLILESLHNMDLVAYVRFASVYKDFKNPSEFYTILKSLNIRKQPPQASENCNSTPVESP